MKKIIFSVLTVVFLASFQMATAQTSPTDKLFEKYNGAEGFTTVHISQELFKLMAEMELDESDAELEEFKTMMENIEYIRIIMFEKEEGSAAEADKFRSELKQFDLDGFTELMVVKEKDEEVRFMIQKAGSGKISELLLLINGLDEAGFISIKGEIDMKSISKISKTMNFSGMDQLEKLDDHDEEE